MSFTSLMRNFQACLGVLILLLGSAAYGISVEVRVSGIEKTEGSLWIALMETAKSFQKNEPTISRVIPVVRTEKRIVIDSVKPGGEYALCVFHDIDDDGQLDKGVFGNPLEPYGFSNNARRVFSMPKFSEAVFRVPEDPAQRAIQKVELR